jgi:hypothetical protein
MPMSVDSDPVIEALVEAIDAYFDDDLERADDATKQGLSEIRKQKGGAR